MKQVCFFMMIFIASCSGQSNPNAIEGKTPELEASPKKVAQIGSYVVEIFEDKKGHLWFGTMANGVACYDGKTLRYFTTNDGLCGNTVMSIAEDQAGNIWFGTHSGASKYDRKSFTNYSIAEGLPGVGCGILVDRTGNIWAKTNEGVFRYDGTAFSTFKIPFPAIENMSYKWVPGKVWGILEDRQGNIWFGRDGFGACKYDGSSFTHFTVKDGLCSNNVCSIVEDKQGNIWFGSLTSDFPFYIKKGGVSRYDGEAFTQYPEMEGLSENDIYTMYTDKAGTIWIGAIGVGVYRYDGENFTLFNKTDRDDLITNFAVQSILEDRNGKLWFGFSGGLFRFNGTSFVNITRDGPWE